MVNLKEIIEKIEQFAPSELASDWDNSGWQVNLGNKSVNKILLALSPTLNVINQAAEAKCDLIISHHPLIFGKLSKISADNETSKAIITAIQNNIQIYSVHTNLDSCEGGIAEELAKVLGLKNIITPEYLQEDASYVRIGELENTKTISDFAQEVKKSLQVYKIKLINNTEIKEIKKVAVVPGSGASLIPKLRNIDALVTGDVKYHDALDAKNFIVIDAGHYETEQIIFHKLKELLKEFNIKVIIAEESPPWEII